MRLIFTSPRTNNVEAVEAMLAGQGIETKLTNFKTWQGSDWKRFSYASRDSSETWPQLWIVHAEDQPRARQLLREAGLEPAIRFADELAAERSGQERKGPRRLGGIRVRLILLVLIAFVVALITFLRM